LEKASALALNHPRPRLALPRGPPYRPRRERVGTLEHAENAPSAVHQASGQSRGFSAIALLLGMASSCLVSGFLGIAPRLGLVIALLCGATAVTFFLGRLRLTFLSRGVALWLLATAVLGLFTTMVAIAKERQVEQESIAAAQRAAVESRAAADQATQLRATAEDIMSQGRAAIAHARSVLKAEKYDQVEAAFGGTLVQLEQLAALVPPVNGAAALREEAKAVVDEAGAFRVAEVWPGLALESAEAVGDDLVAYDNILEGHQRTLRSITGAARVRYAKEIRRAEAALERRRRSIASEVARLKQEQGR
jgi:NACalpha-BTF3-like transcription factor